MRAVYIVIQPLQRSYFSGAIIRGREEEQRISINGKLLNNMRYADDRPDSLESLQHLLNRSNEREGNHIYDYYKATYIRKAGHRRKPGGKD